MRILITGGTGWLGRWLTDSCPDEATVLTRNPKYQHPRAAVIVGDVRTVTGSWDAVIYAANDHKELGATLPGVENCLKLAPRMVFLSSGAALLKDDDYAHSKLDAEEACLLSSASVSIARCYAFVGPGMPFNGQYAVGNFLLSRLTKTAIDISGDGSAVRSYMYKTDFTRWIWEILLRGKDKRIYNVGSSEAVSILTLAYLMAAIEEPLLDVNVRNNPGVPSSVYVPDVSETRRELGLDVEVGLVSAISETLKEIRRQDQLWREKVGAL